MTPSQLACHTYLLVRGQRTPMKYSDLQRLHTQLQHIFETACNEFPQIEFEVEVNAYSIHYLMRQELPNLPYRSLSKLPDSLFYSMYAFNPNVEDDLFSDPNLKKIYELLVNAIQMHRVNKQQTESSKFEILIPTDGSEVKVRRL